MQRMVRIVGRLVPALILVSSLFPIGCPDDGAPTPTMTLTAEPSEIPGFEAEALRLVAARVRHALEVEEREAQSAPQRLLVVRQHPE